MGYAKKALAKVRIYRLFCTFAAQTNPAPPMTDTQILHTVFSFLPFAVCLFWFICFAVQMRKIDVAKRFYMGFLATCVMLYLCHALFFTLGLSYEMECVWTLCSLSAYPLFYGYLCRLTSGGPKVGSVALWLLPSFAIAATKYAFPDAGIDRVRLLLFVVQIVAVCFFGIRRLKAFDRKLQTVYADVESRDTTAVHQLLVAFIVVSVLSGVANSVGRQYFGESIWLLVAISLAFSTMLFALSYICFIRDFTIEQLNIDAAEESGADEAVTQDDGQIGLMVEALMHERHYFLRKDLKIGDVVREVGSNRTYVSNYINATHQCSFSDYMNQQRIEHAKRLLQEAGKSVKLAQIADDSGFANEQSFYRNFKKFTGMTPAEWLNSRQMDK